MFQPIHAPTHLVLDGLARDAFPVFLDHPITIYFDSAATTQKPSTVLDTVNAYQRRAVNIGRGGYPWALEVYEQVQAVRENIAYFLHIHPQKSFLPQVQRIASIESASPGVWPTCKMEMKCCCVPMTINRVRFPG